jgi:hypothetical protein
MEGGACTSDKLLKVIEDISPSVIFCEASREVFQAMLEAKKSFNTPEIKALRIIKEKGTIDIIPVDIHYDPFDERLEAMLELFRQGIGEYFYATEIQANETYRLGLAYLNSKDSDQIFRDKTLMEKSFVARSSNQQLSKTYLDWLQWNDMRENRWIELIHDYFTTNKIETAIFLVGSAHRVRLMEKIKTFENDSERVCNWDFFPFK